MRLPRRRLAFAVTTATLLAASLAGPAGAAPSVTVVADGLNNPRGVDVAATGRVYVAEAGAGRIITLGKHGVTAVVSGLPSIVSPEGEATGVVNVDAQGSGNVVIAVGGGPQPEDARFDTLRRLRPNGSTALLADIQGYRNARPQPPCDPTGNPVAWCDLDQPPFATDSNAYGIAAISGSSVVASDAAGNDLLLDTPRGTVTIARFPNQIVGTSHLPPDFGLPPAIPAEPVPTSVAIGPDGYYYVGELTGFPFTPGASRIWRVAPWARNVTCDAAATSGPCTVWKTGFTSIIDLAFGPDGSLYVLEIAKGGVANLFLGGDITGALWKVSGSSKVELAAGALQAPGGVGVARNGTLYVSNLSISPEDGQVLRITQ